MTEEFLKNLETDLKDCIDTKFHPECYNLLNILLLEEVPVLIEFVRKVNKVLDQKIPRATDDYYWGYADALDQVKRELKD